jgi:paired amphipathic helix protein Sin3a
MPNPIAAFLGLDDPNGGPATLLTQAQEAIRKARPLGASPDTEVNVVYTYFIDACEKWFNNELDPATFEEHMRWFFGNSVSLLCGLRFLVSFSDMLAL